MDKRWLNVINAAAIVVALAILIFAWVFMRDQFMWGVILDVFLFLFVGYINVVSQTPPLRATLSDAIVAVIAFGVLLVSWLYLRDQCCVAVLAAILLLIALPLLRLARWFRDVVSVEVIVHKKENGEGKKP